jgi:hypothetical protein
MPALTNPFASPPEAGAGAAQIYVIPVWEFS